MLQLPWLPLLLAVIIEARLECVWHEEGLSVIDLVETGAWPRTSDPTTAEESVIAAFENADKSQEDLTDTAFVAETEIASGMYNFNAPDEIYTQRSAALELLPDINEPRFASVAAHLFSEIAIVGGTYSEEELRMLIRTVNFVVNLLQQTGTRRHSGRTAVSHFMGTASCSLRAGVDAPYVAVAALHSLMLVTSKWKGEFSVSNVCEARALIRKNFGSEIDELLWDFTLTNADGPNPLTLRLLAEAVNRNLANVDPQLLIVGLCDDIEEMSHGEVLWGLNWKRRTREGYELNIEAAMALHNSPLAKNNGGYLDIDRLERWYRSVVNRASNLFHLSAPGTLMENQFAPTVLSTFRVMMDERINDANSHFRDKITGVTPGEQSRPFLNNPLDTVLDSWLTIRSKLSEICQCRLSHYEKIVKQSTSAIDTKSIQTEAWKHADDHCAMLSVLQSKNRTLFLENMLTSIQPNHVMLVFSLMKCSFIPTCEVSSFSRRFDSRVDAYEGSMISENGVSMLILQNDGNVVIYDAVGGVPDYSSALWASNSDDPSQEPREFVLVLRKGCELQLLLRSANPVEAGTIIWEAGSGSPEYENSTCTVKLTDQKELIIFESQPDCEEDHIIWRSSDDFARDVIGQGKLLDNLGIL